MQVDDVNLLACPESHTPLVWSGTNLEGRLQDGVLVCAATGVAWSVTDGWPRLVRDLHLDPNRARLLRLHDRAPRLHDPLLRLALPLLGATPEGRMRFRAVELLETDSLVPGDAPVRLLQVGVGGGHGLATLARRLPPSLPAELWGVDVSVGMLNEAQDALLRSPEPLLRQARLLLADPGGLPFRSDSFDRVLHLGGLAGFASPGGALRELARVARSGARVVVVEASPGPEAPPHLLARVARRLLPPLPDADLKELVPAGATDVHTERLDPVFVALSFRAA